MNQDDWQQGYGSDYSGANNPDIYGNGYNVGNNTGGYNPGGYGSNHSAGNNKEGWQNVTEDYNSYMDQFSEGGRVLDVSAQYNAANTVKKSGSRTGSLIFFLVFFGVGLVVTIVGIFVGKSAYSFRKTAVEVEASITNIQRYYDRSTDKYHHNVFVDYEFEGENYKDVPLGFYSSNMRIGKKITILCNPDDPYEIDSKGGGLLASVIMIPLGILFMIIGVLVRVKVKDW